MARTVAYSEEYWQDAVEQLPHKYALFYIEGRGSVFSSSYDSYDTAFNKAIEFAKKVIASNELSPEKKKSVISTLQIMDLTETRGVSTAELKNILLSMLKDIT